MKPWCVSATHPFVREISEKYGLNKQDAKKVLDVARNIDPSLRDEKIDFDFVEESDGFKKAMETYRRKTIDLEDMLHTSESTLNDESRDLDVSFGEFFESNREEINGTIRTSKDSSIKINKTINSFKDPRRMDFIGQYLCRCVSKAVTWLQTDDAYREENKVRKHNSRAGYYNDVDAKEAIKGIIFESYLDPAIENLDDDGKTVLADELRAAKDNYYTLLYMYGGSLYRDEGVEISIDGDMRAGNVSSSASTRNDNNWFEDKDDEDDVEDEEKPLRDFSASDQNKSIYSKIVPDIKVLIANCDHDRAYDRFGYGLPRFVDIPTAINRLHKICERCESSNEMMQRLKEASAQEPWIRKLYNALSSETDIDITETTSISSSRKEQLRTMAFQSFVKPFTKFKETFVDYINGDKYFRTVDSNVGSRAETISRKVRNAFYHRAGCRIFVNNGLSMDRLEELKSKISMPAGRYTRGGTSFENMLMDTYASAQAAYSINHNDELAEHIGKLNEIAGLIQGALSDMGVDVNDNDMKAFTSTRTWSLRYNDKYDGAMANVETMYKNLDKLISSMTATINELESWVTINVDMLKQLYDKPEDRAEIDRLNSAYENPFSQKKINGMDNLYNIAQGVRNKYNALIGLVTESAPDSMESSARIGDKSYYSRNNPSTIGDLITKLTDPDDAKRRAFIDDRYCKDDTYVQYRDKRGKRLPHFYSDWLEDLYYHGYETKIDYAEKPIINGNDYGSTTDTEYALSMFCDFFSDDINGRTSEQAPAWYRVLIASDKPRYSMIKGVRYISPTYKKDIAEKATKFYSQELHRAASVAYHAAFGSGTNIKDYDPAIKTKEQKAVIDKMRTNKKKVTIDDVVNNGKYIFRNSGLSFYVNKFINREIEKKTDVGKTAVDIIFNSHLVKNQTPDMLTTDEMRAFQKAFHTYMDEMVEDNFNFLADNTNVVDDELRNIPTTEGIVRQYHTKHLLGNIEKWYESETNLMQLLYGDIINGNTDALIQRGVNEIPRLNLEEAKKRPYSIAEILFFKNTVLPQFIYNNWLAKANMAQILDVDLAFYKDTVNFQKRNAQIISAGYISDPTATIHGNPVTDGKYRSITLANPMQPVSDIRDNIEVMFDNEIAATRDELERDGLVSAKRNVLNALKNFDATDGQALTSLTGLRKRLIGYGEWTRSDDEALDKKGYSEVNNRRIYVTTDEAVYQRLKRGNLREIREAGDFLHVFGQPQKPFVYSQAEIQRDDKTLVMPVQHKNSEYLLAYANAFLRIGKPKTQAEAIARFLEETADDDPLTGIDTVNFVSGVKIGITSDAIDITGLDGEATLNKLRESMYEIDELGNYKTDADKKKIRKQNNTVTEYDIRDYKIVQRKPEHFKRNAQPIGTQMKILAVNNVKDDQEIKMPDGRTITGKELKRRYLDALTRKMEREEEAFRQSLGLNLPHSKRIHKLSTTLKRAMSTDQKFDAEMRKALSIKSVDGIDQFEMPLDDITLQGAVESMLLSKIRKTFYKEKTNGGIVVQATAWGSADDLRVRFYSTDPKDKDGLIPIDADKEHIRKYQAGPAYFECEMPMPGYVEDILRKKGGLEKYLNEDGTWNMEDIREVVPKSAFDCIAYRLPTEAKYSIMVGKIVRFSPSWSGSVGKFPKELTVFTGSDFDIDTDFVELRPIPGSPNYNVDNEIFDLQVAALKSETGMLETFRPGDFSDLSEISYYITLLRNGYSRDELDRMTYDELKDECQYVEDMDLMNPKTDILLKKQNSDASNMIAIAAVGVTSHAFISLYNDTNKTDPSNCVRVSIKQGDGTNENHAFSVINDTDEAAGRHTRLDLSGEVVIDPTHDMDGNLIGTEISKYVGASADAAKDAAEYRLNITEKTLPILVTMHRLGISSDIARLFISQPVVREYFNILNSDESYGRTDARLLEDYAENLLSGSKATFSDIKHDTSIVLRKSELLDGITESGDELYTVENARKLWVLETLMSIQRNVSNLDSFTRYNSPNAMKGSSYLDRLVQRQKIERLLTNVEKENPVIKLPDNIKPAENVVGLQYPKLFTMFPYIGRTVQGESDLIEDIIFEEMRTYSPAFFDMAKELHLLGDSEKMESVKKLRTLYNGWRNYLLFVGENRIADFRDKKTYENYTINFANWYDKMKNDIETKHKDVYDKVMVNNSFIDSISPVEIGEEYGNFSYLTTNSKRLSGPALEKYKRDWESLLDYPETRPLAIRLGIYFLSRSAGYSVDTPTAIMPLRVRQAIPNYETAFRDADKTMFNDNDKDHFMRLFMLNNTSKEDGVVPRLYKPKQNPGGTRFVYQEHPLEEGSPRFKLEISAGRLSEWYTKGQDGQMRINLPVIILDDKVAAIEDDSVEIVKSPDEKNNRYVLNARWISPLGIKYRFAEYVGDYIYNEPESMSVFTKKNGERAVIADEGQYEAFSNDIDEWTGESAENDLVDRRSGSFFSSAPFGDTEYDAYSNLSESERDWRNGFLESRQHLKRVSRIAGLVGFKSENIRRGRRDGKLSYFIGLTPGKIGNNQHEQAKKIAAISSALGYTSDKSTAVKTYAPSENGGYNAIEFAIPVRDFTPQTESMLRQYKSRYDNIDWSYNDDMKEIQVVQIFDESWGFDETRSVIEKRTRELDGLMARLRSAGLMDNVPMRSNFLNYSVLTENDINEILNNIENDTRQENIGEASEDTFRIGGQKRRKIRLGDIAQLAIRRQNGEKVEEEVRELFNESGKLLKRPSASIVSSKLSDTAIERFGDDINSEIDNMYDTEIADDRDVESMIVNVANWIITNGDESAVHNALISEGLTDESSSSIISVIKDLIKELNIC